MAFLPARSVTPRQLLGRLLDEPNLVATVQSLPAAALGKVLHHIGLEDAGEIVALATTEQLRGIFDDDLWHSDRPGKDETFDADRFALWLEVLLEAGEAFAAEKLAELPEDLVTLALMKNVLVVNIEQMAMAMASRHGDDEEMLEKALESCLCEEIDEYRIISRKHDGWDAILSALLALDRDHHDVLSRLLERLSFLTAEYAEDNGGLYEVLTSSEALESDVAADREDRRSEQGYVAPSSAAAFLALARTTTLEEIIGATKPDPITAAYFRSWKRTAPTLANAGAAPASPSPNVMEILRDAEVLSPAAPIALLEAADQSTGDLFTTAMRELRASAPETYDRRMEELAYVTQVLLAGHAVEGRAMRPLEAARLAIETTVVGIDTLRKGQPASKVLAGEGIDKLFRIGWRLRADRGAGPSVAR